jgi:hypothetical protein
MDSKDISAVLGQSFFSAGRAAKKYLDLMAQFGLRYGGFPLRYLRGLRLEFWLLSGDKNQCAQHPAILYAGTIRNKNYLCRLAYGSSFQETCLGKFWLWNLPKIVRKYAQDCSLLVAEMHSLSSLLFDNKSSFFCPNWIPTQADLDANMSSHIYTCKNRSIKSDIDKVRQQNLSFEKVADPSLFHGFYHTMYVPYISKVHTDLAIIRTFETVKEELQKGDLFLLKKDDEYIAGVIILYSAKDAPLFWLIGVKDGNNEYVKKGAVAALYYYSFISMMDHGFKKISLGYANPFLNDGVLQFKKKWGARISGCDPWGYLIKPLMQTEGVNNFLINNPFIYQHSHKVYGALFVDEKRILAPSDIKSIYKKNYFPGMHKLLIYRFGETPSSKDAVNIPDELRDKIAICSADRMFSQL